MKKLLVGILLVMCLSGCVLNHVTVLKMDGDKLGFPIGGMIPVSGENVGGWLVRWFYWTNEEGLSVPTMPKTVANAMIKAFNEAK